MVSGLLLACSEQAAVYVDYVDAYPEGFELEIRASTSVGFTSLVARATGPDRTFSDRKSVV